MPVTCKICGKEYPNSITTAHLRQHGVALKEYQQAYGKESIYSKEYRIKLKEVALQNIKNREEKYKKLGTRPKRNPCSDETKAKISRSIKKYAKDNHDELSSRAYKAIETKISKGFDVAFFRNRKHSEENKNKFKEHFAKFNQQKTQKSYFDINEKLKSINLSCDDLSPDTLKIECLTCNNKFEITKQYFHDCKFHDEICPTCYPRQIKVSKAQQDIFEFVKSLGIECQINCNIPDTKYQPDIFIPEKNLIIEYNGLYWHSHQVLESIGKSKLRDLHKMEKFHELGYKTIFIMEDEWLNKQEIVKSRLKFLMNKIQNKIYARECHIKEIPSKIANEFLNVNHLQGSGRSNTRLGLFYNNILVSVMTFSKSNISRKMNSVELDRFCSLLDHHIVGAANKLFNSYVKNYNPESVLTYADRRWSVGNLYNKMGFHFDSHTKPSYWYFKPNDLIRIHRFTLRKNKDDQQEKTEFENRIEQGYYWIWDCGNSKWVWSKNE